MIFPELPKRYQWIQTSPELVTDEVKTPLRAIDVEQWFAEHGLPNMHTDPAALVHSRTQEPIDWLAQDAWEFYTLCVAMVCWTVYWWGVHHGTW